MLRVWIKRAASALPEAARATERSSLPLSGAGFLPVPLGAGGRRQSRGRFGRLLGTEKGDLPETGLLQHGHGHGVSCDDLVC